MSKRILVFLIILALLAGFIFPVLSQALDDQGFQRSTTNGVANPDAQTPPVHIPGLGWGGIPFDENAFRDVPSEKCQGSTTAEVTAIYELSEKIYLLKSPAGLIVASAEATLKDIETGQRRRKLCSVPVGLKLAGELDCKGKRTIKEDPFKGCAYEVKVWGHSLSEKQAFDLIYKKLREQHIAYKKECVLPTKPKSIKDDLNSLF